MLPCGTQLIHHGADRLHHLTVIAFPASSYAVAGAKSPARCCQQQCLHVIVHIQPIAHIQAIAIERNRLSCRRLEDHHRDQLLWVLPGPVVVAAVGEHHRQPIGVMPGPHQVVAGRLAGGVGAAGVVGRGLREAPLWSERPEHLIGADVMETEIGAPRLRQRLPVAAHRLQQMKGAVHIAADECPWPSDRAIHMALGRQVQHQVGIGLPHRRRRGLSIGKIHPQ